MQKEWHFLLLDSLQSGFKDLISFVPQNSFVRKNKLNYLYLSNILYFVLLHVPMPSVSSSQNEMPLTPLPCDMLLSILKD